MKRRTSFLEFVQDLKGYKFKNKKGKIVPKYILYWNNYQPAQLIFNRTDIICEKT